MVIKTFESFSEEDTKKIGKTLAEGAVSGQLYCLNGDLGVGKTAFSKGFAAGLGVDEHVTSPTFTIINTYESGNMPFYHFDVYRITDPYELDEIGYEDYFFGDGVTMVEWASLIEEVIPESAIDITITKDIEKGLDYRMIEVKMRK